MNLTSKSIHYFPDASTYFKRLRQLPRAVWLDSCAGVENAGQIDILTAAPIDILEFWKLDEDSFEQIEKLHSQLTPVQAAPGIPFTGGCLGYFSYESNHPEHGLQPPADPLAPLIGIGLYNWALIQDHARQSAQLVFHPSCENAWCDEITALLARPEAASTNFRLETDFQPSTLTSKFIEDVEKIQNFIKAGDCYQVNYSQHFHAPYTGDELEAYMQLRDLSPTPLAAYMDFAWGAILSLSPERFVSLRDHDVHTFPIKGTMPRGKNKEADRVNYEVLRDSMKDRAENLMIVDLMRNDLSRVSRPGSVRTPKLFELQSFPTVHHLVSEVCSELRPEKNALDLLRNCLPGGSISGAPKRRALEIIDSLEAVQRSIYCGSIFYWSSCGNMDSSIAIRTLLATKGELHCWGGGGITADSDPEKEWQETLDKVQPLMERLQDEFAN